MTLLKTTLLLPALTLAAFSVYSACTPAADTTAETAAKSAPAECALTPGKYDVQSATFQNARGEYDLFVLGAPACVRQPVTVAQVKLVRIETADGKAQAKFEVPSAEDPTLHLTENFKIDMVNAVVENGQVVREESSSWMPFLAGAAGAAVVGMAVSSMFNRPQYYQPPPMRPGMAEVRGYGASGATHQSAMSNYQSKYNAPPASQQPQNKSFFRQKSSAASAPSGAGSSSNVRPQKSTDMAKSGSSQPQRKRGFFRRRGR